MTDGLLDGPKHGYALKKRIDVLTGHGAMHNNLVYPLLKRFVAAGWVSRRRAAGERGQTRAVYSLTEKGKRELLARLVAFTEKEASSGDAFRLRVGLFGVLQANARGEILRRREKWLAARAASLAVIAGKMPMDGWGEETVGFLRNQVEAERKWLERLRKTEKTARP